MPLQQGFHHSDLLNLNHANLYSLGHAGLSEVLIDQLVQVNTGLHGN
jgi:hypothetical protein